MRNYVCGDQGCNYCFPFSEEEVESNRMRAVEQVCGRSSTIWYPALHPVLILENNLVSKRATCLKMMFKLNSFLWLPRHCVVDDMEEVPLGTERLGRRPRKTLEISRCL